MSKIICKCGNILSDNTDNISYKARYIADQDFYDFYDELEKECPHEAPTKTLRYFGVIFQCPECGNLIIFSADDELRCDFQPCDKESGKNITISFLKEKWKGYLYGHYYGDRHPLDYKRNKGELYWYTNKEQGYLTGMSLEDLRINYYKKMEELKSIGILRGCFLSINGENEHKWPAD